MKELNAVNMRRVEKDLPGSGNTQGGHHPDGHLLWGRKVSIFPGKVCGQRSRWRESVSGDERKGRHAEDK